jgi:hypothetical protein
MRVVRQHQWLFRGAQWSALRVLFALRPPVDNAPKTEHANHMRAQRDRTRPGDYGQIDVMCATCPRCGHSTESFGTSDASEEMSQHQHTEPSDSVCSMTVCADCEDDHISQVHDEHESMRVRPGGPSLYHRARDLARRAEAIGKDLIDYLKLHAPDLLPSRLRSAGSDDDKD